MIYRNFFFFLRNRLSKTLLNRHKLVQNSSEITYSSATKKGVDSLPGSSVSNDLSPQNCLTLSFHEIDCAAVNLESWSRLGLILVRLVKGNIL